jgi:hypothetical protein
METSKAAQLALGEEPRRDDETEREFHIRLLRKASKISDRAWDKLPADVRAWCNEGVSNLKDEKPIPTEPSAKSVAEQQGRARKKPAAPKAFPTFLAYLETVAADHLAWWRGDDPNLAPWHYHVYGNLTLDDEPAIIVVLEKNISTADDPRIERRSLQLYIDGRQPSLVWNGETDKCVLPVNPYEPLKPDADD